jgi:hypothetical protein
MAGNLFSTPDAMRIRKAVHWVERQSTTGRGDKKRCFNPGTDAAAFAIYKSSNQTVSAGSTTAVVEFGSSVHSYGGVTFSTANYTIQPGAGVWANAITVQAVSASPGVPAGVWVENNGTRIPGTFFPLFGEFVYSDRVTIAFDTVTAASDVLRLCVAAQASGTMTIKGSTEACRWQIHRVRDS